MKVKVPSIFPPCISFNPHLFNSTMFSHLTMNSMSLAPYKQPGYYWCWWDMIYEKRYGNGACVINPKSIGLLKTIRRTQMQSVCDNIYNLCLRAVYKHQTNVFHDSDRIFSKCLQKSMSLGACFVKGTSNKKLNLLRIFYMM